MTEKHTSSQDGAAATPHISEQERQRRLRAIQGAEAIGAIKGVPMSDFAQQLFMRWADGEITHKQMCDAIMEHYRRIAEEKQSNG